MSKKDKIYGMTQETFDSEVFRKCYNQDIERLNGRKEGLQKDIERLQKKIDYILEAALSAQRN